MFDVYYLCRQFFILVQKESLCPPDYGSLLPLIVFLIVTSTIYAEAPAPNIFTPQLSKTQ